MEKGLQLASKLHKRSRRGRRDVYLADRINELPDEILTDILSRLTMREAVRTSVLSRRWKDLWTFTTGSLDFEFGSFMLSLMKECSLFGILEQERARYINRVNKILNSHKGATIDELKIEFDLRLNDRLDIDSWINFAIRKKVRRLDLKLEPVNIVPVPVDWEGGYPFPAVQCLGNNSLKNISCLTSLNLNFVNVTDEVLEYLLSNCPSLEFVRVLNSPGLEEVRVIDPCPKLKHLEIAHCYNLAFLDISSAPSLTSLAYSGPQNTTLCLSNVPNLSDVSLGSFYGELKVERFCELPIALSQIEKLKLSLCEELFINFPKFPELKNVKQLELELQACDEYSLLSCASVIEACPKLYRLSIQFDWLVKPQEREVKQRENCSIHKCLKVVELVYFRGSTTDVELATYLLWSTPFLEKILVDTRRPFLLRSVHGRFMKENVSAKECARRLAAQFSPSAELVTL